MLFIVSLAIFTIILTITENLFLAIIALLLLILWIVIINKFTKKWKIWQKIWLISLAFILSLSSIFIKVYRYDKKVQTISTAAWLIAENMEWPQWSYFIWTWIISDIYSYQKYIFQDGWGREYFLKSEKSYKIWDEIWLNWYVSPGYTWAKDIFNLIIEETDINDFLKLSEKIGCQIENIQISYEKNKSEISVINISSVTFFT